jgi:hypothetical protein
LWRLLLLSVEILWWLALRLLVLLRTVLLWWLAHIRLLTSKSYWLSLDWSLDIRLKTGIGVDMTSIGWQSLGDLEVVLIVAMLGFHQQVHRVHPNSLLVDDVLNLESIETHLRAFVDHSILS